MNATETQVQQAARLYEMRARARRLLGDRYKSRMAAIGSVLQAMATKNRTGILETAIDHATKRSLVGIDLWLLMAAAVELTEPST